MGRIIELPESVRVRIAAGEVVERPASVVKELVDNAIDAGASTVTVELARGGIDLIRVTDDGCGMDKDDLLLSVRRHATSKLETADDLVSVLTLGFRGEALPSIGSVSRLRITTRMPDADAAWELLVDGGVESEPKEIAAAPGTTVEVTRIFQNVPVRRRFLRSPATEGSRSSEAVLKMALARPEIAFRLVSDGRETLSAPAAADRRGRIASVAGPETASSLIEISSGEPRFLSLHGFIGPPDVSRSNRSHVHIFINGRPVDEPVVIRALRDGYAGAMAPKRYPVAFLFLEVEPEDVDVNVHPAKREVRLHSAQAVFRLVHGAVKEAVIRTRPSAGLAERSGDAAPFGAAAPAGAARPSASSAGEARTRMTYDLWAGEREYETAARARQFSPWPGTTAPGEPPMTRSGAGLCYYVGQTAAGYLVAEVGDELRVLDPHALHERVIFERLSAAETAVESQRLLTPETIELDAGEAELLESVSDELARLGFEVEPFGTGSFLVRSVPSVIRPGSAEECVRDILDRASGERGESGGALREKMLAAVACAAAVKLGERMTAEQAVSLVEEAELSGVAERCPHGRPTSLVVKHAELERRFGR